MWWKLGYLSANENEYAWALERTVVKQSKLWRVVLFLFASRGCGRFMCTRIFVSGACSVITRLSSRTGVTAARKKVRIFCYCLFVSRPHKLLA